jgi:hypothetical protein
MTVLSAMKKWHAKAQRRKEKEMLFLCVLAPLREKFSVADFR